MNSFPEQVAKAYFERRDLHRYCFIFPNQRSKIFFTKYLAKCVRDSYEKNKKPLILPEMYTVNDFFYKVSGCVRTDNIYLILELYECYVRLYENPESLDEFWGWASVIISDFDDIDKYLANPEVLLTNVSDYKNIIDKYEYLSEDQINAISSFVSHFEAKMTDGRNMKVAFLRLWNNLHRLYCMFNKRLEDKKMSYEGMVYRRTASMFAEKPVADISGLLFDHIKYVFVGLNVLNECEKLVFRKMQKAGLAEFCWDYCSDFIKDENNKSSFFMSENISEFPSSIALDKVEFPEITVVNVPSSVGQTKIIPQILEEIASVRTGGRLSGIGSTFENKEDCAIVLADETLLPNLLNSIPEEIDNINVTMGYPLTGSACYLLIKSIMGLQLSLKEKSGKYYFNCKHVYSVFGNSLFKEVLKQDEQMQKTVSDISSSAKYYIDADDFGSGNFLSDIFRPVSVNPREADPGQNYRLQLYLRDIIEKVAANVKNNPDLGCEPDFLMSCYKILTILMNIQLPVLPSSFFKIFSSMASSEEVHFKGEPLKGLQIMGLLETRAIDFKNLIVLSCNEDILPRKNIASSFIPAELRKGFGLPTYELQDALWAYYFYRMIQRPERVWMIVDSRPNKTTCGEESRYIKQLELYFKCKLKRKNVDYGILGHETDDSISKTPDIVEKLKNLQYSPSLLVSYLSCNMSFYYKSIEKLFEEDEISDVLDKKNLGNVLHAVMFLIYTDPQVMSSGCELSQKEIITAIRNKEIIPLQRITEEYLDYWIKDSNRHKIELKVGMEMLRTLKTIEISGRNIVIREILTDYVIKILMRDRDSLKKSGRRYFEIFGLEKFAECDFHGYKFKGFMDRVDKFAENHYRIVDYKTGKVLKEEMIVTESTPAKAFERNPKGERPKIAIQFYIYNLLLENLLGRDDNLITNAVYPMANLYTGEMGEYAMTSEYKEQMESHLYDLLEEIVNPEVPFKKTEDLRQCKRCVYKNICGR